MEEELEAVLAMGTEPILALILVVLVRIWWTDCGGCERRLRRALDHLHEAWQKTHVER